MKKERKKRRSCGRLLRRISSAAGIIAVMVMVFVNMMPAMSFAASGTGVAASDTLKISVGYFGGPYYVKKTYTLADIQSLPAEEYWYSNIDSMPAAVVLYAKGVTLKNLFYDAGIDVNSVQYMHFKTTDNYSDTMTSWSLTELLDSYTPRYSYTALPENFVNGQVVNLDSVKSSGIQVPTMIAYSDTESGDGTNVRCISGAQFWNKKGANENNRFRLVFGQKSPDEASYGKAAKGITEIEIQLAGSPTYTLNAPNTDVKVGSKMQVNVGVKDVDDAITSGAAASRTYTYTSSNEAIATVDANGNVTAVEEGDVTITATASDGQKTSVNLHVSPKDSTEDDTQKENVKVEDKTKDKTNPTDTQNNNKNKNNSKNKSTAIGKSGKTGTSSGAKSSSKSSNSKSSSKSKNSGTSGTKKGTKISAGSSVSPTTTNQNTTQNTTSDSLLDSTSDTGSSSTWRAYQMSEDSQELAKVDENADNPMLPAMGWTSSGVFGVSFIVRIVKYLIDIRI